MTLLGKLISINQTRDILTMEFPLEGKICNVSSIWDDSKVKQLCKVGDYLVIEVDMGSTGLFDVMHMSFCKI